MQNDWPKKYTRDPIVEVIIGVRFDGAKTAEQRLQQIHEQLERELPGPAQDLWWIDVSTQLANQEFAAQAVPRFGHRVFSSADGQWRLTVGDGLAALHVMRPYPGWKEQVRERAGKMLAVCTGQMEAYRLREVSVRYVDEIALPQNRPLATYFQIRSEWPEQGGEQNTGFDMLLRRRFPSSRARGQVRFFSLPDRPAGLQRFVLDVAAIRQPEDEAIELDDLQRHLEELHLLQRQVFESVITKDLQDLLGAKR